MSHSLLVLVVFLGGCVAPSVVPVSLTSATVEEARGEDAAQMALHRNEPAEALGMADRALRHRADLPWAHYERAMALVELDRVDEALPAFARAAELHGDDHPRGKELALHGSARALLRAGRCEEARTAYGVYASFVQRSDPSGAARARAYANDCRDAAPAGPDLTTANAALMSGDHTRALALAVERERTTQAPRHRAWLDEVRARALAGLGRYAEAVAAFERAAQGFEAVDDPVGRGRALYGEALTLRAWAQCDEATRAFERHAAFVRPFDADGATRSELYARDCPGLAAPPAAPRSR